jgi:hypothetical protein
MEPIPFQITVDCDDPHAQARFWAAALGYDVEDNTTMIRELLRAGVATDADVVEIDARLAWRTVEAIRGTADTQRAIRLLFQHVPDRTPGKNSWHLDLNVGKADIDAHVARLTALGARELYKVDEPGAFHTTMADPEGNLFCIQ